MGIKMTFKSASMSAKVDWEAVNRATEIKRTYEIILESGGIIFKMYKPSEFHELTAHISVPANKSSKWKSAKMVGVR